MWFYQIFLQILGKSEFNKYLVSGTFAFLADYSVLLIATELLGIHYLVSAVFGYAIGLLVSYMLNIRWVFRYRKYAHTSKKEFLIFVVIVIVGLVITEAVIFLLVEQVAVSYQYAKIVSVGVIFVFNFIAKKHFLFTRNETH